MSGLWITGTDTGVGKTVVAAAIAHLLESIGHDVAPFKPVAAGCRRAPEGLRNQDAEQLAAAVRRPPAYEVINPVALEAAAAPHLVAEEEGVRLEARPLAEHIHRHRGDGVAVVEGAGGWLVPLNGAEDLSELAVACGFPVVLVVGLKLGCLNHALLTRDAVRASGLPWGGWVAVDLDTQDPRLERQAAALETRLPGPFLGRVPWLSDPSPAVAASWLRGERLVVC